jgi:hypothetical protein
MERKYVRRCELDTGAYPNTPKYNKPHILVYADRSRYYGSHDTL